LVLVESLVAERLWFVGCSVLTSFTSLTTSLEPVGGRFAVVVFREAFSSSILSFAFSSCCFLYYSYADIGISIFSFNSGLLELIVVVLRISSVKRALYKALL
jgi:hypothetical protein